MLKMLKFSHEGKSPVQISVETYKTLVAENRHKDAAAIYDHDIKNQTTLGEYISKNKHKRPEKAVDIAARPGKYLINDRGRRVQDDMKFKRLKGMAIDFGQGFK